MPLTPAQDRERARRRRQDPVYQENQRQRRANRQRNNTNQTIGSTRKRCHSPDSSRRQRQRQTEHESLTIQHTTHRSRDNNPTNNHQSINRHPDNPPPSSQSDPLPWWHRFHASMTRSRWQRPTWDRTCQYCGALLLKGESLTFSCNGGQHVVPPLPPLPVNISHILSNPNDRHQISASSRRLNNLFSFTAIGATKGFAHFKRGPASVAITGRTYPLCIRCVDSKSFLPLVSV
jgi:hypothetical protein